MDKTAKHEGSTIGRTSIFIGPSRTQNTLLKTSNFRVGAGGQKIFELGITLFIVIPFLIIVLYLSHEVSLYVEISRFGVKKFLLGKVFSAKTISKPWLGQMFKLNLFLKYFLKVYRRLEVIMSWQSYP